MGHLETRWIGGRREMMPERWGWERASDVRASRSARKEAIRETEDFKN